MKRIRSSRAARPQVRLARLHVAALAAFPLLAFSQEAQLGEVNVTSTSIDDRFGSKRTEPSSTSEISGKTIDAARPENLIQVLQSIPGVTADTSSGDELKIKLRGIENQRYMGEKPGVAIVIDGVPVFERTGKVNIDLDNIESIKVVKGGASYLFGEDALVGAVIVTTKRGAKYKGYTVAADQGAWGYNRQLARAGFAGDWGSGHVQATHRESDDYYWQSGYKTDYLDGNLRFYLGETSDFTVGFEKSDRTKDKHGSVTGAIQAELDPTGKIGRDYTRKYDVGLQKLNATYSNDLAPGRNLLVTGYEYRDHTMFWSAPQRVSATGATIPNSAQDAYTVSNDYHQVQRGLKSEYRGSAGGVGWLGGLDLRRNQYKNFNKAMVDYCARAGVGCAPANLTRAGTVLDNDVTDEAVNALYGELKFAPAPKWTLTGNARYDHLGLDYSSAVTSTVTTPFTRSKSFNVASWRAGANYAASESLDYFGNVSTGFRTPTAAQLYSGTNTPTSQAKTAPNDSLRPEHALNLEIGTRARTSILGVAFDLEAAAYQVTRKDFILAVNGQYGVSSTTMQERYENIGGVRNRGIELSLKSDRKREYTLDVAYSYIQAVFTQYDRFYQVLGSPYVANPTTRLFNNTGNLVPRVPRHTLNTTAAWLPNDAWRVSLEMDAKSWSYADEINQVKLPGRTLFNLLVNYDVKGGGALAGTKWSLFGRIDNLLDKNYWSTARGTNDSANYLTGAYDGRYDRNDPSIIVGKPRYWTVGLTANF
ncbi:MAG TPA: TonB-dependent receptor [Rhodocyclaceae bacterium]